MTLTLKEQKLSEYTLNIHCTCQTGKFVFIKSYAISSKKVIFPAFNPFVAHLR